MARRIRFVSGIFALVAMLLSLAGGAWASMCAPEMGHAVSVTSDDMPMDHDCMSGTRGHRGHDSGPYCPFGPAGTLQGCAAAASLPAASNAGIVPAPEGESRIPSSEAEPDLLLGTTLFHPPRA